MLFSSLAPSDFILIIGAGQSNISGAPNPAVQVGGGATIDGMCWGWDGPLGFAQIQQMVEPWSTLPSDYKPRQGSLAPHLCNGIAAASGKPVLYVATAIGGSALLAANDAAANWSTTGTLFEDSCDRADAAIDALLDAGHTISQAMVVWSQGYADALAGNGLSGYGEANGELVGRYRTRLTAALGSTVANDLQFYTEENYAPEPATPTVAARCETIRLEQIAAVGAYDGFHIAFNDSATIIANNWLRQQDHLHYSIEGLQYMGDGFAAYIADERGYGDIPVENPPVSHVARRLNLAPPITYPTPPVAPVFVRAHTGGQTKTTGTTLTCTMGTVNVAGNTLYLAFAADNATGNTSPNITGISKPGGESASWVFKGQFLPFGGTGANSVIGELWAITTTVAWTGFSPVVTIDTARNGKAVRMLEFSGATTTLRGTVGVDNDGAGAPSAATGADLSDLVIGMSGWESDDVPTGDSDTTNGSWSTVYSIATTGGLDESNILVALQYKITTGTGTQTYNPTGAVGDCGCIVAAFQPAP